MGYITISHNYVRISQNNDICFKVMREKIQITRTFFIIIALVIINSLVTIITYTSCDGLILSHQYKMQILL